MKHWLFLAAFVSIFTAIGCHEEAPQAATGHGAVTTGSTSDPAGSTPTKVPASAVGTPGDKAVAPPPLPAALKTDAYHWYGLGREKPINLTATIGDRATYSGAQTIRLKSVKDGKAIFELERSGDLGEHLGSETLSLEKDGIFTVASSLTKGAIRNIEVKAPLTPGSTWHNTTKIDMTNGQRVEQDEKFTVVGVRRVATLAGKQDALMITAKGNMSVDKTRFRMESTFWYVRDKGLVKNVVSLKDLANPKAKPQVITIQETK